MKIAKKVGKPAFKHARQTRKQLRKAKRLAKKVQKHDYYTNRNKPGRFVLNPDFVNDENEKVLKLKPKKALVMHENKQGFNKKLNVMEQYNKNIAKEKHEEIKLKAEMQKERTRQMIEANRQEDENIKMLAKQLKLKKTANKSIPKSFAADGLDYLLEVCDLENMKDVLTSEIDMNVVNDTFDEDLALMTLKTEKPNKKKRKRVTGSSSEHFDDDIIEGNMSDSDEETDNMDSDDNVSSSEYSEIDPEIMINDNRLVVNCKGLLRTHCHNKSNKLEDNTDKNDSEGIIEVSVSSEDGAWEDIYGRLRDKDGNIVQAETEKYIPPGARTLESKNSSKLFRLKRTLKGSLNRLAESNMHSITNQIETLYMHNSRNDMNETLTSLISESLLKNFLSPERLILEHVVLIITLHANVGSEVGAHFLQFCVKKFEELLLANCDRIEDKYLDNIVIIISQLYNFKLFNSQLIFDILTKLAAKFDEKHVECILHVLKNVGFTLRKDDPATLKNFITKLHLKAPPPKADINPRIKFMLDILFAIQVNNVNKIPNYDTSYSEHLKKIMKNFIRKGNYVTQLNIRLDDLLKADECGKWWVVGSAWSGKGDSNVKDDTKSTQLSQSNFSHKLLALAKKQRMNTDTRRNIFCIIMSAEDYMDAFEKLLHLGLKSQQEIINVLVHCCLSEKEYNHYYSVLAQKFCDYDRKFQLMIKYTIWDKVKALIDCSPAQISNLAKLLTYLFLEKGLSISTLKIVEFGELDQVTLRFIRLILIGVLLTKDLQQCQEVFQKVAQSDKLKVFREHLRVFIHHFLLKNLKPGNLDEEQKELLEKRARLVEKALSVADKKNENMDNVYDDVETVKTNNNNMNEFNEESSSYLNSPEIIANGKRFNYKDCARNVKRDYVDAASYLQYKRNKHIYEGDDLKYEVSQESVKLISVSNEEECKNNKRLNQKQLKLNPISFTSVINTAKNVENYNKNRGNNDSVHGENKNDAALMECYETDDDKSDCDPELFIKDKSIIIRNKSKKRTKNNESTEVYAQNNNDKEHYLKSDVAESAKYLQNIKQMWKYKATSVVPKIGSNEAEDTFLKECASDSKKNVPTSEMDKNIVNDDDNMPDIIDIDDYDEESDLEIVTYGNSSIIKKKHYD